MMKKEVIYDKEGFSKAVQLFIKYKPVKVKRGLKDDFIHAISKHFSMAEIPEWHCTIYSLVKSYKFKRTQ
jgi:hypothetical protein